MGMPRGLIKATAYYNKIEALKDWQKLADEINDPEVTEKYKPLPTDGWKTVDKKIAKMRAEREGE
jgi:hypothetical protein